MESRRLALLVPEQLNVDKGRTEEVRWAPWLVSDPLYLSPQGSCFLLRSTSSRRRGGTGAQQGEGCLGGGVHRDEAGEALMGVKGVGKRIQKKHYEGGVQAAPRFSLSHFSLQYLTWRSQDMENCAVRGKLTVRRGRRI